MSLLLRTLLLLLLLMIDIVLMTGEIPIDEHNRHGVDMISIPIALNGWNGLESDVDFIGYAFDLGIHV